MGCRFSRESDVCVRSHSDTPADAGVGDTKGGPGSDGGSSIKASGGSLYDHYNLGTKLGEGAFGAVYACAKKGSTDYCYAVKMVDKVEAPLSDIMREVDLQQKLQHENVAAFREAFFEKVHVAIVMDKYEGDLIRGMQAHWKSSGKIPLANVKNASRQMARAVRHLHSLNIVHRDVKGDNFLMGKTSIVDDDLKLFLADFGMTLEIDPRERLTDPCGTQRYWPPEFYDRNYSFKVDVWAVGVVVFGMIEAKFPFKTEAEVRRKRLSVPDRADATCKGFITELLTKEEKQRIDAEGMLKHPWIKDPPSVVSDDLSKQAFQPGEEPEKFREGGANAGVSQRRNELMERLQDKAARTRDEHLMSLFWKQRFAVQSRTTQSETRYEWWTKEQVETEKLIDKSMVAMGDSASTNERANDQSVILQILKDHDIDVSTWGTGQAHSFEQFAAEVQSGAVALKLDATTHKKLVRVTDVVLLRISFEKSGTVQYLIEDAEKMDDGRTRPDLHRLPGTKKEPHENSKRTTERIVAEKLGMEDCQIAWGYDSKEVFEEQEESLGYPGVTTVYRKEIIPGKITTKTAAILERVRAQRQGGRFSHCDRTGTTRNFGWYTEPACKDKKIQLRAPAEGDEVSGIVQAPIGFGEEELKEYLEKNGLDASKFGKDHCKSLKDFSEELLKGESSIMVTPEGNVLRVIDLVLLRLIKEGEDKTLIALEEEHADGSVKKLRNLPGGKRRPDENQFLTAQRVLKRQLKMDENYVSINDQGVLVLEEEKESPSYPGLRTLYRKRIIQAVLYRRLS